MMDRMTAYILKTLVIVILAGCKNYRDVPYTYQGPKDLNDGITVGSLAEINIDPALVVQAVKKIKAGVHGQIHSFLVYKSGKLIVEEYFPGNVYKWEAKAHHGEWVSWSNRRLHSVMSVTKSITSASIGVALDKGFIRSVDQSIFDYLPDHQHLKTEEKSKITIEHLLTMTPGLEWQEWGAPYSSAENPMVGIWYSDKDPVSYILEGTLEHQPGTNFSYYGGNHILLGEILKNATNMTICDLSKEHLFKPMGIDSVHWAVKFDNGVIETAGGLKMKPRDMLKFGIMFLNDGAWNKKRVLSKNWVDRSSKAYHDNTFIKVPGEDSGRVGYAYSWWTKTVMIDNEEVILYWASGWGGQKIVVIPSIETVVVFTGGNYLSGVKQFGIIEDFMLLLRNQNSN